MDTRLTLRPKETFGDATLHCDDCRYVLPKLGPVDLVLTDPPYGMTGAKWDRTVDIGEMWSALKAERDDATFILTASQPFTSRVVMGNEKDFRVEWIWEKNAGSNFGTVKVQPMKEHESVLVFSRKSPFYTPIMQPRAASGAERVKTVVNYDTDPEVYPGFNKQISSLRPELRYPRSIQKFNRERGLHPTQKPVALMEYFIRTYTRPGNTVLDPYMGSGSTAVACARAGRKFIGIEIDRDYYDIACNRLNGTI